MAKVSPMLECLGLQAIAFLATEIYLYNTEQHLSNDPVKGCSRRGVEKQRHFLPLQNPQQSPIKIHVPGHSKTEEGGSKRSSCCYIICSLSILLKY